MILAAAGLNPRRIMRYSVCTTHENEIVHSPSLPSFLRGYLVDKNTLSNFLNCCPCSLPAIQPNANGIVALLLHLQIRISNQELIYARLSQTAKTGQGRGKECLLFKIFAIACITLITITTTPNATTPTATPVLQLRVLSLI